MPPFLLDRIKSLSYESKEFEELSDLFKKENSDLYKGLMRKEKIALNMMKSDLPGAESSTKSMTRKEIYTSFVSLLKKYVSMKYNQNEPSIDIYSFLG